MRTRHFPSPAAAGEGKCRWREGAGEGKKRTNLIRSSFSFVWHEACEERIAAVKIDGGEEERSEIVEQKIREDKIE